MKPADVLNVVFNTDVTSDIICMQKPVGVTDAAVFLMDTTKLRHPDDLKADDMGSWVHKGIPSRYYSIERSPSGVVYGVKHCSKTTRYFQADTSLLPPQGNIRILKNDLLCPWYVC